MALNKCLNARKRYCYHCAKILSKFNQFSIERHTDGVSSSSEHTLAPNSPAIGYDRLLAPVNLFLFESKVLNY